MREVAVSEYYSEGPKAAIWLMDFEYRQLTGVAKCELNTWEWQNSNVAGDSHRVTSFTTMSQQDNSIDCVVFTMLVLTKGCLHNNLTYHYFLFTHQIIDIVRLYLLNDLYVFHTAESMSR